MIKQIYPELPLEGTRISIGWLFLSWPELSESLLWVMLFLKWCPPVYIDTNHNDAGGDAHFM
jgi:hypothetical protein